jgi:hypothetical protein
VSVDSLIELADRNTATLLELLGLEPSPQAGTTGRPLSCAWCGGPIAIAHTGRPRLFCSDACRRRAWRAAQAP